MDGGFRAHTQHCVQYANVRFYTDGPSAPESVPPVPAQRNWVVRRLAPFRVEIFFGGDMTDSGNRDSKRHLDDRNANTGRSPTARRTGKIDPLTTFRFESTNAWKAPASCHSRRIIRWNSARRRSGVHRGQPVGMPAALAGPFLCLL